MLRNRVRSAKCFPGHVLGKMGSNGISSIKRWTLGMKCDRLAHTSFRTQKSWFLDHRLKDPTFRPLGTVLDRTCSVMDKRSHRNIPPYTTPTVSKRYPRIPRTPSHRI